MKTRWKLAGSMFLVLLTLGVFTPRNAWSIPSFARKEKADCALCHTTVPRLNEYGFNYRKAGFRDPSDIGKELGDFNYADVYSARVQARYDVKRRDMGGDTDATTSNQLTLHEVTVYPLSGSFGKNYGSLVEMSMANEDFVEIENAYFRYTRGTENEWFSGRVGIFHPFEGYGASDRPFSLSRPFFQGSTSNNGTESTYFKMWGFDQAGVELAYVKNHTSFSATVFNGIYYDEADGKAFPAAGGHLQKPAGSENQDSKDIQLFVNHALDDAGSGLSLYYYYGKMDLPNTLAKNAVATSYENGFQRVAAYGSYALTPKFEAQGGFAWGQDDYPTDADANTETFTSQGFFGEADFHPTEITTVGGRYDWYDPSSDVDDNEKWGATLFVNHPFNDGFQVITEFKHVQQKRGGSLDDVKDDNFQVRFIWLQ